MRKFKLVKDYPDSGKKVGDTIEFCDSCTEILIEANDGYSNFYYTLNNCEKFDNWEEVVEKDYEVLKVIVKPNHPNLPVGSIKDVWLNINMDYFNIYSIKRLSDNKILTVGDRVSNNNIIWANCFIESFKIYSNISIIVKDLKTRSGYPLESLKILKPLITTEDNIEVYPGDKYWCIDVNDKSKIYTFGVYGKGNIRTDEYIFFSTEKAAEEYILMNKPCLSINDVINNSSFKFLTVINELKEKVKKKE